jgi:hypothetical protein
LIHLFEFSLQDQRQRWHKRGSPKFTAEHPVATQEKHGEGKAGQKANLSGLWRYLHLSLEDTISVESCPWTVEMTKEGIYWQKERKSEILT